MQPQPIPVSRFLQVRYMQAQVQATLLQMHIQGGVVGKRYGTVQRQSRTPFTVVHHLPGLLPGAAMNRVRVMRGIWRQSLPTLGPGKAAFGDTVGPRRQRVAG
ncbi:hypothetical protein D3C80_1382210 [compost metagenome]